MKLVLVGGFLGSGKTTAITAASRHLIKNNRLVAVITNDQGEQQVDTLYLKGSAIPVEQVTNGCFCCNYNQLDQHLESLIDSYLPEFIFAESVGSCTDLIATIAKPLSQYRPQLDLVISVFADASLLLALLEERAAFIADNIRYIYKKQLDDADIIVINKSDTITTNELDRVITLLKFDYPNKIILNQNSTTDKDIEQWLSYLQEFKAPKSRTSLDINYDRYADGEAALAWLDKKLIINSESENAPSIAIQLAQRIHERLLEEEMVIGHLKIFIEAGDWNRKLSFTLGGGTGINDLNEPAKKNCTVLINARIQTDPLRLKELVDEVIQKNGIETSSSFINGELAYFQPGYPRPTHRFN